MKRVLVNPKMIANLTWNKGYGNKILHLLFVIKLANLLNRDFQMPDIDILDEFFELEEPKTIDTEGLSIYQEISALSENTLYKKLYKYLKINLSSFREQELKKSIALSQIQFQNDMSFLKSASWEDSFYVEGHFWHYKLMPSQAIFDNFIKLNQRNVAKIKEKFPEIGNDKHVAVHLRDTDFKTHLKTIFNKSICLPDEYYYKAIDETENVLGEDLIYHLFSDNIERLKKIFKGKKVIVHQESAALDWLSILLAKNVIQSNSSFCWTASLYNKSFSVQPKGGYNWAKPELGSVPFGYEMPFSQIIDIETKE